MECLRRICVGSTAVLRGSLERGDADAYSDIDIAWEIPDEGFLPAMEVAASSLAEVRPVASFRSDTDFSNSLKHRLLFVRFDRTPLFWRADIEVFARSIGGDAAYDKENPAARGTGWSYTESALMNAIGAIKAILRGREADAEGLISRAFERFGRGHASLPPRDLILPLVDGVVEADPTHAALADEIRYLYRRAFEEEA